MAKDLPNNRTHLTPIYTEKWFDAAVKVRAKTINRTKSDYFYELARRDLESCGLIPPRGKRELEQYIKEIEIGLSNGNTNVL